MHAPRSNIGDACAYWVDCVNLQACIQSMLYKWLINNPWMLTGFIWAVCVKVAGGGGETSACKDRAVDTQSLHTPMVSSFLTLGHWSVSMSCDRPKEAHFQSWPVNPPCLSVVTCRYPIASEVFLHNQHRTSIFIWSLFAAELPSVGVPSSLCPSERTLNKADQNWRHCKSHKDILTYDLTNSLHLDQRQGSPNESSTAEILILKEETPPRMMIYGARRWRPSARAWQRQSRAICCLACSQTPAGSEALCLHWLLEDYQLILHWLISYCFYAKGQNHRTECTYS